MTPRVQNGARVFLYINGTAVGLVTDFSFSSQTSGIEISGIDVDFPIEIGPGTVRVSGSLSLYKLINDAGAQTYGLTTSSDMASLQKYVTLTLVDRGFDITIFKCDYAKITNETWSVSSKSLMMGQLTFEGIGWSNNY